MTPNSNKTYAATVLTLATALESSGLLPHGIFTALGMIVVYVLGMIHPKKTA